MATCSLGFQSICLLRTSSTMLVLVVAFGLLPFSAVRAQGPPPTISSSRYAAAQLNNSFAYQITASKKPTRFAASGLPPGLIVNNTTGLISGKPLQAGTFAAAMSAANAAGTTTAPLMVFVAPVHADMNIDLTSDLFWQNADTGERDLWTMSNNGQPSQIRYFTSVTTDWRLVAVADFNGDGYNDILWHNSQTGRCHLWVLAGTQLMEIRDYAVFPLQYEIDGAGDLSGDGQTDLVLRDKGTGDVYIQIGGNSNLGPVGTAIYLGAVPTVWQIAAVGDLDNDGTSDLLWQNTQTGERDIWTIRNGQVVSISLLATVPPVWQIAGTGDFNGDGLTDIVWQNSSTGERDLWLRTPSGYQITYLATVPVVWSIANH